VPFSGRRIHDQERAFVGAHLTVVNGTSRATSSSGRSFCHHHRRETTVRPTATGLATAFFRLYLLEGLAAGPSRPAALLAAIAAERLPFAAGAFGRALQSLVEGGYLAPGAAATVCLTALGAAERMAERERWSAMLPTLIRLLGDAEPRPFPVVAEVPPPRERPVAEAYLDRVLVASVRERIAAARDGGPAFAVVLAQLDVDGVGESTRRAMVHRAIRATLGATATLFGGDVSAYRYGDSGVAALAPDGREPARAERLSVLVRARLDELMRTMTSTVRAFGNARWNVRAGSATWSEEIGTTTLLLRKAEEALSQDGQRRDAA
jgi:GGDEF domain-containing protein